MTVGRHSASISGVPLGGHDVVIRRNQRCSLGRSRPGADRAADASRAAIPPRRRSDVLRPHRVGRLDRDWARRHRQPPRHVRARHDSRHRVGDRRSERQDDHLLRRPREPERAVTRARREGPGRRDCAREGLPRGPALRPRRTLSQRPSRASTHPSAAAYPPSPPPRRPSATHTSPSAKISPTRPSPPLSAEASLRPQRSSPVRCCSRCAGAGPAARMMTNLYFI